MRNSAGHVVSKVARDQVLPTAAQVAGQELRGKVLEEAKGTEQSAIPK